ncbi:RNA 2',3'-cyclic phosphodiesterase [Candidatus Micrarchaeota archaeon]|nr:RNA 2',3'-cyclic phosphodiesterase [Candidatus Micrarchaeota archaeon]
MRVFVALDLPAYARARLAALQAELRKSGLVATYPLPEQLHVTLAFFGNSADKAVEQRKTALAAFSFPAFDASLDQIGFFPSESRINVVWSGFGKGKHDVIRLQRSLAEWLQYRSVKPFFPHVTLARIKQKPDVAALALWAEKTRVELNGPADGKEKPAGEKSKSMAFRATTLKFYESILGQDGPLYRQLAQVKLKE